MVACESSAGDRPPRLSVLFVGISKYSFAFFSEFLMFGVPGELGWMGVLRKKVDPRKMLRIVSLWPKVGPK